MLLSYLWKMFWHGSGMAAVPKLPSTILLAAVFSL